MSKGHEWHKTLLMQADSHDISDIFVTMPKKSSKKEIIDLETRLKGVVVEKDTELRVTSCNDVMLKLAGVKSKADVLGRTDYDFIWQEYADFYATHERDALMNNNYSAIIPSKDYTDRIALSLHTKIGKKDEKGNIIGVICRAVEIINPRWDEYIHLLGKKSTFKYEKYCVGKSNPLNLTPREKEILFYLIRGKSVKTVATILNRSVRTVEHHIEHIKEKFDCRTRAELIGTAINYGYMEILPNDTIKNLLTKIKA